VIPGKIYAPYAKRIFDILMSSLAIVLLSPVMAIAGLCVWIEMGRPILFRQQRPGRRGLRFRIYKFRTMNEKKDTDGRLRRDGDRLTSTGNILRKTSIDEIPELFNVLKGDMSLVGPRPLLMQYLDRYTPEQARRHEVNPGITGWAQVQGRNAISWEDKFKLDVWYVDHISFRLDVKILLSTLFKVLRREGINQPGQATMEEFRGEKPE
jgi:sugar transferase EpsL